jgi:hypothetical protein
LFYAVTGHYKNYEKSSNALKADMSEVSGAYPVCLWKPGKREKESTGKPPRHLTIEFT